MKTQALKFKLTLANNLAVCSLLLGSVVAHATDLSNSPLTTSTATAMRPNIMFVLDDSGSMASRFMPDYVDDTLCKKDSSTTYTKQCVPGDAPYYSAGFNGMYYNPLFVYLPPVNADGSLKPDQFNMNGSTKEWKQVQNNPYLNASAKDNIQEQYLDQQWCTSKTVTSAQRALTNGAYCRVNGRVYASIANPLGGAALPAATNAYNYPDNTFKFGDDGNGTTFTTNASPPFYYNLASMQWCDAWTSGTCGVRRDPTTSKTKPRFGAFSRVDITPTNCTSACPSGRTYAAEMTNFANWYAYYRDRLSMMKTGVGRAFSGLDDNYRVGFMTIHTTPTDTSRFIQIKTNDTTQKNAWYNKLYSISTTGSTPLRPALSTAGQMYAGKALVDPVQYSCQKNFTILSTDGFWNGGNGFKIDNSAIGNQDNVLANAPRPKYDGGALGTTVAGSPSGTIGGAETLADIALYYYNTDLRTSALGTCTGVLGPGTDVCQNNVAPTKKDPASHQHMTVFTIGLGVDGLLGFRPDYETASTGDFAQIRAGTKNWPSPTNDDDSAVDDLWHAAVNAGATYYSAKNPQALSDGLGDALREVGSRAGSAAAASTSNPQVTTTDNFVFSANYRTAFWDSVIRRRRIDVTTGELSKDIDWEAGSVLNTMVSPSSDVRTIYMFSAGAANKLKAFDWSNLTAGEKAYFDINSWADPSLKLSQWAGLTATGQTAAKASGALVGFLRGQGGLEDDAGSADLPFRGRENVLGDIVSAETVYLKKSNFSYLDAGYDAFRNSTATRQGVLFAAANDGMLHAFNADTGRELWAYMPSMILPKLYKLADKNYVHDFFVDGTPEIGDVFDGTSWRTIIVGGLNEGGKGYYALDVTDPLAPKALWQYCDDSSLCSQSDAHMGHSYGNPVITKLGTEWVVMFTSGYNNDDSKGYLYVVNPITGANKFSPIVTSCTGANCGISKIAPWIENYKDNTTARVYAGDLDGNLWRFDVNNSIAPAGRDAFKLAQLGNQPSLTQSITTKPGLAKVGTDAVVFVGTGRFLGVSDKSDSSVNSFYAIKDNLSTTALGTVRTSGALIKQTLTFGTSTTGLNVIKNTNNAVDWTTKFGWYLDFPSVGERVFTDPAVVLGTVTFTTNIPTIADPCSGGGISWIYELNWKTGGSVLGAEKTASGDLITARFLANEFATRPVVIQVPNGEIITLTQLNTGDAVSADGKKIIGNSVVVDDLTLPDLVQGRRAGWREIIPER
jgi:type IV pilus assembly protein PilY1